MYTYIPRFFVRNNSVSKKDPSQSRFGWSSRFEFNYMNCGIDGRIKIEVHDAK